MQTDGHGTHAAAVKALATEPAPWRKISRTRVFFIVSFFVLFFIVYLQTLCRRKRCGLISSFFP